MLVLLIEVFSIPHLPQWLNRSLEVRTLPQDALKARFFLSASSFSPALIMGLDRLASNDNLNQTTSRCINFFNLNLMPGSPTSSDDVPNPQDPGNGNGEMDSCAVHVPSTNGSDLRTIDSLERTIAGSPSEQLDIDPKSPKFSDKRLSTPDWLPENWRIELKVRSFGKSAGNVDKYYLDPSGRKYRSKNEVCHFLETGRRLKRCADGVHSESSVSHKQKKSGSVKRQKSEALNLDVA